MPQGKPTFAAVLSFIAAGALALLATGCGNPLFSQKDYLKRTIAPEEVREIQTTDLQEQSTTPPVSVEQGAADVLQRVTEKPPPAETLELELAEVRAAAIRNNLDLGVEVYTPAIAELNVDVEEARFESVFFASFNHVVTDSPVILGTEGSNVKFNQYDLGVDIPLRTGGTVRVDLPFNDIETNNPFSLLNPAYEADLRFSISQPLLRNAGVNVNTHPIRVARYEARAAEARTKLEAIRILANADRMLVMKNGAVELLGPREEVMARLQQARPGPRVASVQ